MVAAKGMKVECDYVGVLDDGEVFGTSKGTAPLSFVVGSGSTIPGFEEAVVGMHIGETKEVRIETTNAYGERDEKAIEVVKLDRLPEGTEVGANLSTGTGGTVVVTAIDGNNATLDLNHPLAGKASVTPG